MPRVHDELNQSNFARTVLTVSFATPRLKKLYISTSSPLISPLYTDIGIRVEKLYYVGGFLGSTSARKNSPPFQFAHRPLAYYNSICR